jgi:hypothetical protein
MPYEPATTILMVMDSFLGRMLTSDEFLAEIA